MDTDYFDKDHSLTINFEGCSLVEIKEILLILHSGSTECYHDIELAADEIITRLDLIGYELNDPQNKVFISLVHYIFKILKKIKSQQRLLVIHKKFNDYISNPDRSPAISPINSPKS
jgi:hypothetical protein